MTYILSILDYVCGTSQPSTSNDQLTVIVSPLLSLDWPRNSQWGHIVLVVDPRYIDMLFDKHRVLSQDIINLPLH